MDAHGHCRHGMELQEAGDYRFRSRHLGGVGSQELVVVKKSFSNASHWRDEARNVMILRRMYPVLPPIIRVLSCY